MERRSKQQFAGALIVLGLGILPALAQFPGGGPGGFPGGFGASPILLGASSPEMNKKLTTISALREILGLKLTNQDISSALPSLKALRDDEKLLQTQSLDALTEEENALIAVQPGGQLPPDSGARLQQLHEQHHETQENGWSALVKKLGQEKTDGIRSLVGQEAPRLFAPGAAPGGFPGAGAVGAAPGGLPGANNPLQRGGLQPGGGPETHPDALPPFLRGNNNRRGGPMMPFMRGRVNLEELIEAMELKVGATK